MVWAPMAFLCLEKEVVSYGLERNTCMVSWDGIEWHAGVYCYWTVTQTNILKCLNVSISPSTIIKCSLIEGIYRDYIYTNNKWYKWSLKWRIIFQGRMHDCGRGSLSCTHKVIWCFFSCECIAWNELQVYVCVCLFRSIFNWMLKFLNELWLCNISQATLYDADSHACFFKYMSMSST